jgi:histone acetyltransferase (RNA polymerase elongator complex component)
MMLSKCRCDNECFYCNEQHNENGKHDYCDYVNSILTKDRKFFISMVGCITYMRR